MVPPQDRLDPYTCEPDVVVNPGTVESVRYVHTSIISIFAGKTEKQESWENGQIPPIIRTLTWPVPLSLETVYILTSIFPKWTPPKTRHQCMLVLSTTSAGG